MRIRLLRMWRGRDAGTIIDTTDGAFPTGSAATLVANGIARDITDGLAPEPVAVAVADSPVPDKSLKASRFRRK